MSRAGPVDQGLKLALPLGADRDYARRPIASTSRAGEVLCIVGESGSGKSLCAHALMGLLPRGGGARCRVCSMAQT